MSCLETWFQVLEIQSQRFGRLILPLMWYIFHLGVNPKIWVFTPKLSIKRPRVFHYFHHPFSGTPLISGEKSSEFLGESWGWVALMTVTHPVCVLSLFVSKITHQGQKIKWVSQTESCQMFFFGGLRGGTSAGLWLKRSSFVTWKMVVGRRRSLVGWSFFGVFLAVLGGVHGSGTGILAVRLIR